jgi:hypothetical protein
VLLDGSLADHQGIGDLPDRGRLGEGRPSQDCAAQHHQDLTLAPGQLRGGLAGLGPRAAAGGLVAAVDQPGLPHPELVTRAQGALAPDPLAVDEGAVARIQVANTPARLLALQHRVQPRQGRVGGQREVVGRVGAERV